MTPEGIAETEALAAILYAIWHEAYGKMVDVEFDWPLEWFELNPRWKEAWIQVAQFVEARQVELDEPDHR